MSNLLNALNLKINSSGKGYNPYRAADGKFTDGPRGGSGGKLKEGDKFKYDGEEFTARGKEGVSKDGKRVVSPDAKTRAEKDKNRKRMAEAESLYEESKKLLDTVSEDPDRAWKSFEEADDLLGEVREKLERAKEDKAPTNIIRMLESAEALALKCVVKAEE